MLMKSVRALGLSLLVFVTSFQAWASIGIHESGRYFTDSGQPVFLLGHYVWASPVPETYIDSPATYRKMVDNALEHGLNYIRIHLSVNRFSDTTNPLIYAGEATPTPFVYVAGKADLDQWNEAFWTGLEETLIYARNAGVIVHIALFDGVSLRASGNEYFRWIGSSWNINNQVRNFFGDLDYNANGRVDDLGEFYQTSGFNSPDQNGTDSQRLGYYQQRFIAKTIAVAGAFDNVFFQIGNELGGADRAWNQAVASYFKSLTDKPVTFNHGTSDEGMPASADALTRHHPSDSVAEIKTTVASIVGQSYPAWMDPDGSTLMLGRPDDNRRAAWYSLTGGAAGWGGYNIYTALNNEGMPKILEYYQYLSSFIADNQVPFWKMIPYNQAISNANENNLLALPGENYLAYVLNDASVEIEVQSGTYNVVIFNPVTGQTLLAAQNEWQGLTYIPRPQASGEEWVVYAEATDVQPNAAPTINITQPLSGSSFELNSTIVFQSNATDTDGSVVKVEYYAGDSLLGTATQAPYELSLTMAVGDYAITAKAYDDSNEIGVSSIVSMSVLANQAPQVSITQPANNSSFSTQDTINFQVTASDTDGSVTKVEYYADGNLFATVTEAPFSFSVANAPAGSFAITARAYDDSGNVTSSDAVQISIVAGVNQPPQISITQPVNGSAFTSDSTIAFQVLASDADGSISKVVYFAGDVAFATVSAAPFSYSVANVPAGNYDITALAYDNKGATTRSSVIQISVSGVANQAPVVAITQPASNSVFTTTSTIVFQATASDADGTISKVEYYAGDYLMGVATSAPYQLSIANAPVGSYDITARATDNKGAVTRSSVIRISVN